MSVPLPTADEALTLCRTALGQIEFARQYVLELLQHTPQELWFDAPAGAPTCVAWHVGHLAVSEYGLLMFRQRGRRPEDLELIPGRFRKAYGRGSQPQIGPEHHHSPAELLERLAQVHAQASAELRGIDRGEALLEPVEMPYAVYPVKLGAILFCPLHEQIHAGQIGLLRRLWDLPAIH